MVTRTVNIQTIANATVVVTLVNAETLESASAIDSTTSETITISETNTAGENGIVSLSLWPTDRSTTSVMYAVSSNGATQYETLDSGATATNWNHYLTGTSGGTITNNSISTRKIRQLAMPQHNFGLRRYNWASIPAISGATGANSVSLCRVNFHGVGFQGVTGSRTFGRVRIATNCLGVGTTLELTVFRDGNTWRVDKQAYLGGSADANSYYAYSRGSAFKPNQDGWMLITGQTENNSSINPQHTHHIGGGVDWAGVPLFWPEQTDWSITHYHPVSVPYKINKTSGGSLKQSFVDQGSSPQFLDVGVYTDAGVSMDNPYTSYTTQWIELRISGLPQIAGICPPVNTTLEFADCNHTVWFYDSEKDVWETPPIVAVTGDSAVEGTDHRDLVFFNYSDDYYGSVYRHAWTEKRGYWNYAWDGSMMVEMITRMRIVSGDLQLEHKIRGWSDSKGFTHVILGVGANEAVERVLRRRGRTNRYNLASWNGDYVEDFKAMVDKIKSATARSIQPILLLHANVWDAQAIIATGGGYGPLINLENGQPVDGDYMTVQDWENVAVEFGDVTDKLYEYATEHNIPVIDWFMLSEWHKFNDNAGTFMTSAGHYNINGLLTVADYADVVRRI